VDVVLNLRSYKLLGILCLPDWLSESQKEFPSSDLDRQFILSLCDAVKYEAFMNTKPENVCNLSRFKRLSSGIILEFRSCAND
jgi:hypothetical protein